jgi:hypothetical protein
MKSLYDPSTYPQGVPNPYGPRVHAWTGGPFDEGTRFHGAVYTRPQATFPWHERPLWSGGVQGVGAEPVVSSVNRQWWDDPAYQAVRTIAYVGSMAGTIGGAYHGYKRNNGSVGWAIGWAILGSLFWPITIPVMLAQGFGEKK